MFRILSTDAKARYLEKVKMIDGIDPFDSSFSMIEISSTAPPDTVCDLVSYLVLQTSFVTSNQFKAYKSLEAYNQFVCGWVKEVSARVVAGKYVVFGYVS